MTYEMKNLVAAIALLCLSSTVVALAVLFVGVGLVELIVLSI